MNKETIKTILIIMLCSLGLFLLRSLWFEDLITLSAEENVSISRVTTDHLLTVKALNVSFGGGRMSAFYFDKENVFENSKQDLNLFLSNIETIRSISETEYYQNRLNKSIEFKLIMPLTQSEILSLLNSQDIVKEQIQGRVNSILFVAREMSKVWLICDDGYYELVLNVTTTDMTYHIDALNSSTSAVAFQTVAQRFGLPAYKTEANGELFNQVLIPKFSLPLVLPLKVETEIALADVDELRNIAKNVFGNRLDFVQEARDINGSMVFLYGYGDRALRVSDSGVIEYSERFNDQLRDEASFIESMSSALTMLDKLGGPINDIYLMKSEQITRESVKGYRFEFGYRLNDYALINLDEFNGAVVEVYGGKVKKVYRKVLKYSSFKALTNDQSLKLETDDAQFFNMISQTDNFKVIEKDFYSDRPVEDTTLSSIEKGQAVLNTINDVYVGFYFDGNDKLQPGMVLQIGKREYCIDFYTYNLIKKE